MFHEIDAALTAVLRAAIEPAPAVWFGVPGQERADEHGVGLFLHAVREDLEGRTAVWLDERDERGAVVARRPPPRRYRVCYLVTCWSSTVEREHALLGHVLATLVEHEVVPAGHLTGSLRAAGTVRLDVAQAGLPTAPVELWSAYGIAPRAALDLVVTAPLAPAAITELRRAPEEVALGVDGGIAAPAAEPAPGIGPPRKRVAERG